MKQWLKRNFGLVFILLLTLGVAVVLLRSGELPRMLEILGQLDVRWVWASFACIAVYFLLRAVAIYYYLRSRRCPLRFHKCLIVASVGQFYSAVTPSSSGGQPMQVLSMHQMGIPISIGTSVVSIKFIMFQIAFMLMGGVLWLTHLHMVAEQLGPVRWLVALGYLVNALLVVVVLMTMVRQAAVDRLVAWAIRMAAKLRLIRNVERMQRRAEDMLEEYRDSLLSLRNRPMDAMIMFALGLAQAVLLMVVVLCLYHAFKLSDVDGWTLLAMQLLLYITSEPVPLPGAAIASEVGFYLFFKGLIPEDTIVAFMVCWRFFTLYLLLILGLLGVVADYWARRIAAGRQEDASDG